MSLTITAHANPRGALGIYIAITLLGWAIDFIENHSLAIYSQPLLLTSDSTFGYPNNRTDTQGNINSKVCHTGSIDHRDYKGA